MLSFLDLLAMKEHNGDQSSNARLSVFNSLPCSHSFFHVGNGSQRLRSRIAVPKIIVRSVAMFLEFLESLCDHLKIFGLTLNRPNKRGIYRRSGPRLTDYTDDLFAGASHLSVYETA